MHYRVYAKKDYWDKMFFTQKGYVDFKWHSSLRLNHDGSLVYDYRPVDMQYFIVERSTGKIDTSKKEIFEGDILKKGKKLYVVSYFNSAFALLEANQDHLYAYICQLASPTMGKVVGNVHDNKNLLDNYLSSQ